MSGESHFHPCPGCHEAVECQLAIGDEGCGKLRCANCSGPTYSKTPHCKNKHPTRPLVCTLQSGHGGTEHVAHGVGDKVIGRWPMVESVEADGEEEPKTCDNCGEDITSENPAMEWDGDPHCKECYPICADCKKPINPDNYFNCHRCENCLCERHAQYCQCCDEYFCKSHAQRHGI